ncbi:LacI family DNA-binding transcriptional regulator [Bifidobacterium animalis]|uniref:LacI family transcriptional regulator n=1 Tax=Bifidobacterium animalis subsp. lactis TaxID=302911 RepID=A0A8B3RFP9_BIFAN|nr:LacI family DNA-binding transcriptional regulator [Bifidobacterium animalis]RYM92509.1 LacI family transcriptional regulator [Bifidobacterium animalis subsp. lactis]
MNASIQDVAKAAHVSISTVSRSFTRPELVSAATREKVLRIAEELNFSTSRSAAALKTGHAMRVALLMSDHIRLWFSASVIEGLNQVLHAEGYDISIFQISSIEERRDFFEMLPVRRNADAVIVASFDADETEIAQLASANVPIIGINSVMPRELGFTAAVNIDDTQGSILAARHLINLGHRDIAYVRTNRDVSLHFSVQQRFDSFMECCAGSGISPTVIVAQEGPDRIRRVLTDLMSLERMPTAIACQEDGIAVPLIFQLERSGYEVPNDISVIGYDNSFYANDIGLTTIAQDPIEMAKMAAEMTVKLIEGEKPEHLFRMIPAELVVRSSTAKYIA